MSSANAKVKEVESPILKLNRYGRPDDQILVWENNACDCWCCHEKLAALFAIDPDKKLVFVAKAKADRSTHRATLYDDEYIAEPVNAPLYPNLGRWIEKQIKAGRPNIGVRIIQ